MSTILYVENELMTALPVTEFLRNTGRYEVLGPFTTLDEAYTAIEQHEFDLALLDLHLDEKDRRRPTLGGFSLVKAIREHRPNSKVMVMSKHMVLDVVLRRALGDPTYAGYKVDGVISKSADPKALLVGLARVLEQSPASMWVSKEIERPDKYSAWDDLTPSERVLFTAFIQKAATSQQLQSYLHISKATHDRRMTCIKIKVLKQMIDEGDERAPKGYWAFPRELLLTWAQEQGLHFRVDS
jgi:DNA-binding NarL/FixJ family response regulator